MKGMSPIEEPMYEASVSAELRFDASQSFTASSECPIAWTGIRTSTRRKPRPIAAATSKR